MIRKHIDPWLKWFKHVVTQPRHQLDRSQAAVRYAYDLGVHGYKALNRDNAPQMAAALAFRTLFALLPVLVVSTVVIRALRGEQKFFEMVSRLIAAAGLKDVEMIAPVRSDAQPGAAVVNAGQWLEGIVREATNVNLAAIGWIGFVVLAYSAIGLMVTIENSFNAVYGAPQGRSWARRVPIYWTVLTVGPAAIAVTLYLDNQFASIISGMHAWKWLLTSMKVLWGFAVAWLFMLAVYRLVPNTRVAMRPAMIGAMVAAVFLQIGKSSLGAYLENAVSLRSLYGSLGLVPLFMFWVYLMWLVVLFGLEVSATIQSLQGRRLEELEEHRPQNGLVDPASVLAVMEVINERFAQAKVATAREIADETLVAESLVCLILDRLAQQGMVHRVEGEENSVTLARPPEQIGADRLIEIGYSMVDEGGTGRQSALVKALREAQLKLAHNTTLASLLGGDGRSRPSGKVVHG
jgi:membrane protein